MKHTIALLLVLAICAGLFGCGAVKRTDEDDRDGSTADPLETDPQSETLAPVETIDVTNAFGPEDETEPAPTVQVKPVVEENISDYHYEIKQVATFGDIDRLAFSRDFPVVRTTSDGLNYDYLYSYTGELLIQDPCQGYEHFGDGITAMYCKNGDSQTVRLVNVFTGEILFDDSTILQIEQLSSRYYYMIHSAGYGLVYDMQLRKFLHDLMVTDSSSLAEPFVIDSTLFVYQDYGCYDLYLDDGSVVSVENVKITSDGYLQEEDKELLVFDSKCNLLARIPNASPLSDYSSDANDYSDRYFRTGDYMAYSVVNLAGQVIVSGPHEDIRVIGDYILAGNEDTGMALFLGDGTQLTDFLYGSAYSQDELPVIQLTHPGSYDTKFVYVPGKGVLSLDGYTVNSDCYYSGEDYRDRNYFILSSGQSIFLTDSSSMFRPFLMESDQGITDLVSGRLILPAGYDFAAATGEYLYVYANNVWTVYTLELVH